MFGRGITKTNSTGDKVFALIPTYELLETKTRQYWFISSVRYGRIKHPLHTERAIKELTNIHQQLGPKRRLRPCIVSLKREIISPPPKPKSKGKVICLKRSRKNIKTVTGAPQ